MGKCRSREANQEAIARIWVRANGALDGDDNIRGGGKLWSSGIYYKSRESLQHLLIV